MWTPNYYIRYAAFPLSVEGVTVVNDDGTFDIYLNSALTEERQRVKLEHEINHIKDEHFYRPLPVAIREAEANGNPIPVEPAPPEPAPEPQPLPPPPDGMRYIKLYNSLDAVLQDALPNLSQEDVAMLRAAGYKG